MKEIRIDTEPAVIWRNPDSVFKYNGWPSVCCDERGVLYVTASGFRIQHVDPSGKNVMFVSPDGGHKWSRPIILNDSYLDDRDTGIISLGGGHMIATCSVRERSIHTRKTPDYRRFTNSIRR